MSVISTDSIINFGITDPSPPVLPVDYWIGGVPVIITSTNNTFSEPRIEYNRENLYISNASLINANLINATGERGTVRQIDLEERFRNELVRQISNNIDLMLSESVAKNLQANKLDILEKDQLIRIDNKEIKSGIFVGKDGKEYVVDLKIRENKPQPKEERILTI